MSCRRPSENPIRGFSDGTSQLRALIVGKPRCVSHAQHGVAYTLAEIEVFFASGSPRQKKLWEPLKTGLKRENG